MSTTTSRRVMVWWRDTRDADTLRYDVCRLRLGYSTEADLPKIIAIARLGGLPDADKVEIVHTEEA